MFFADALTKRCLTPLIEEEPLIQEMSGGVCPYRLDGKCSVYPHRFSGCRIFTCGGEGTEQENALCEQAVRKFKDLCEQYDLPYHYLYLKPALQMLRDGVI
jgi:hypothetical protein